MLKMNTIEIQRKEINLSEYKKRTAFDGDFSRLIIEPTIITENGVPIILYAKVGDGETKDVRAAVRSIRYQKSTRTTGLSSTSAVFGYNPRNTIRRNYCGATAMSRSFPAQHATIAAFSESLTQIYQTNFPDVFSAHEKVSSERILPEWHMGATPFTSGIVNKNNPLKYHFDSGNIEGVFSNMVVFKSGVSGGHLSCPEFGLGFECADNTIILFDGQKILHGVTPIKNQTKDAYRYSVVYYTLQQMWNCLPISDEIIFARKQRVRRENKRVLGGGNLQRDK